MTEANVARAPALRSVFLGKPAPKRRLCAPNGNNPHGLTDAQARVMDAFVKRGSVKRTASDCDISPHTVACHIAASRKWIGESAGERGITAARAAVLWDRARMGSKK